MFPTDDLGQKAGKHHAPNMSQLQQSIDPRKTSKKLLFQIKLHCKVSLFTYNFGIKQKRGINSECGAPIRLGRSNAYLLKGRCLRVFRRAFPGSECRDRSTLCGRRSLRPPLMAIGTVKKA